MLKTRNLLDQLGVEEEEEGLEDPQEVLQGDPHQEEDPHLVEICHQDVAHHPGVDPHHQLHAEDLCHQRGMVLTMVMTDTIGHLLIVDLLLLIAVDTHPKGIMNERGHPAMGVTEDMQTSILPQIGGIQAVIVAMVLLVVTGMEVKELATLTDTAAQIDILLLTTAMVVNEAMKEVAMELVVTEAMVQAAIEGMGHLMNVQAMVHLLLAAAAILQEDVAGD